MNISFSEKNVFKVYFNLKTRLTSEIISLDMFAVRSYYKREFLKKLQLHRMNLHFLSEGAHAFFVVLLLLFAILLLLTTSAPLQCPAAQKIWKYLDKLHQLSMHISSTESWQYHFCTQILHWQQPSPSFCYIPNTTTWYSIVCFINLLMSSSKYIMLEGTVFMLCFQLQLKRIFGQAVHFHDSTKSL